MNSEWLSISDIYDFSAILFEKESLYEKGREKDNWEKVSTKLKRSDSEYIRSFLPRELSLPRTMSFNSLGELYGRHASKSLPRANEAMPRNLPIT